MNLGLGSKRKLGKVLDTGYPTSLLVQKASKSWWIVKGGGSGPVSWLKKERKCGLLGDNTNENEKV